MIIYAVTNGFLDDVPVADIREWERGFHEYMSAQYPQVGDSIRKDKQISKDTESVLQQGIKAYKAVAQGAGSATPAPAAARR
jgi:F-type H+-transporting ATPase subunit alpha